MTGSRNARPRRGRCRRRPGDDGLARQLGGHGLDVGGDHLARAAPGGPEVHDRRLVGLEDGLLEGGVVDLDDVPCHVLLPGCDGRPSDPGHRASCQRRSRTVHSPSRRRRRAGIVEGRGGSGNDLAVAARGWASTSCTTRASRRASSRRCLASRHGSSRSARARGAHAAAARALPAGSRGGAWTAAWARALPGRLGHPAGLEVVEADASRWTSTGWPLAGRGCGREPPVQRGDADRAPALAERPGLVAAAVVMVQVEVAMRSVAGPGEPDRGFLSALVEAAMSASMLFSVPARCFNPPPRVTPAVVRLEPRSPVAPPDEVARALEPRLRRLQAPAGASSRPTPCRWRPAAPRWRRG